MQERQIASGGTFSRLTASLIVAAAALLTAAPASAVLVEFSYTFSGSRDATTNDGPGGQVLSGVVDGQLQADGDTLVINEFVSASLDGYDYSFSTATGLRAGVFGEAARLSLSGSTLDFWVCQAGFTTPQTLGDPINDCPFGSEGGFLISQTFGGLPGGGAIAGAPIFGDRFRARDFPVMPESWSATLVPTPAPLALLVAALLLGPLTRRGRD